VLLRLAYLGTANVFALLRLLPMSNRDKDAEILALRHLRGSEIRFGGSSGQLGSGVVLVGESGEDLLPPDPVVGEVDRPRWPTVGLSWCELAEAAVRPGGVVVPQVLGQDLSQMVLIDDQQPVEDLMTGLSPSQAGPPPSLRRLPSWLTWSARRRLSPR
jgi:hypothetical protein